jgi:F420-dependent oxidoreductase-like protein
MKLGFQLERSGSHPAVPMDLVLAAEKLGFDSVWSSESWGADAVSPVAWVLARTTRLRAGTAIMQIPARTPALTAMTAMTLNAFSGGRFILGLGPSGPQVVEGWHGVAYGNPLERMREYVGIVRKILDRAEPLTHTGAYYDIPYHGAGSSGLGKPLKGIIHSDPALKILIAAITPAGLRNAAEIADGVFPIFMSPERFDVLEKHLAAGFDKTGGRRSLANFAICPFVPVSLNDDLDSARLAVKQHLGFYIGGMGARDRNFYKDYATRLGYGAAATQIQELFLSGRRKEAIGAVPNELVDEVALAGPAQRISARVQQWKIAAEKQQVDTMILTANVTAGALAVAAEAAGLAPP